MCFWFVFTFNRLHGVLFKEKLLVRISISSNNGKIFTLQKKIVRTMAGAQTRTSCSSMFKQLQILPVPCQYEVRSKIFRTGAAIYTAVVVAGSAGIW